MAAFQEGLLGTGNMYKNVEFDPEEEIVAFEEGRLGTGLTADKGGSVSSPSIPLDCPNCQPVPWKKERGGTIRRNVYQISPSATN